MALQSHFGFRHLVFLFHFFVTTIVTVYQTPAMCSLLYIHSFNMHDSPAGIVIPIYGSGHWGPGEGKDLVRGPGAEKQQHVRSKLGLPACAGCTLPSTQLLRLGDHHGSLTDMMLRSVPLSICGVMNSQRIKHVHM